MASLTDLAGAAKTILELFQEQLRAQELELPERQCVAPGAQPVWDGEQLTVSLMGLAQGTPGAGDQRPFIPPQAIHFYASFSVSILRSVSVVDDQGIPTAEELTADGQLMLADTSALVLAATAIYEAGTLAGVGQLAIDGVQTLGPDGGLAGVRLLLSVSLS